ncbi:NAD(P)-binding protein [Meredithblackwellia eburnea MCA 4105]
MAASKFIHPALRPAASAVITGAAVGGIGASVALLLAKRYNMHLLLADISSTGLAKTLDYLVAHGVQEQQVTTRVTDVSIPQDMFDLADYAFQHSPDHKVDFLFLNAGAAYKSKDFAPGGDLDNWLKTMSVNFGGVLNGTQAFVQRMVDQGSPAAVVVTGSKQGITQPPGNPAYNVSKSAVKSLTESLAHSLIPTSVTAHLLVPGYTYTKITTGSGPDMAPDIAKKPAAAWHPDQVAEELFARLDEFYIICPDNDVDWALDSARMAWNADDILKKRPALSRWHPEHKDAFAKFVEDKLGNK